MKHVIRLLAIVTAIVTVTPAPGGGLNAGDFCGDVNGDGTGPNIGDICAEVSYLFIDMPPIPNYRPAEIDGIYGINVLDLMALVNYAFQGGPLPTCMPSGDTDDGYGCLADSTASRDAVAPQVSSSGCTSQTAEERMWAEFHGYDLYVYHYDVEYNCCMVYDVVYSIDGWNVTAVEYDRQPEPCYCLCYFNLESTYPRLGMFDAHPWFVTLIGVSGDTVGVDTVAAPSANGTLDLQVVGNDLHVLHYNANANCCPAFFFDYYVAPGEITVIEWDSLDACDCYCRFNLESVVPELDPGQYTVTVLGVCIYPYAAECDTVGVETVTIGPAREP